MGLVEMEYDESKYQVKLSVGGIDPDTLEVTVNDGRLRIWGQAFHKLNNGEQGVAATCDWSTKLSKFADGSTWETKSEKASVGEGGSLFVTFPRNK